MTSQSPFLAKSRPSLRVLAQKLASRFDFCSILGTDCVGAKFEVSPKERNVSESMWTERGFVVRAIRNGRIVERSFDAPPPEVPAVGELVDKLTEELEELMAVEAPGGILRGNLRETDLRINNIRHAKIDPFILKPESILDRLDSIRRRAEESSPLIAMAQTRAEWTRFTKMYISKERDLEQSYICGQAYVTAAARRNGKTRRTFEAVSGLKGFELLDELEAKPEHVANVAVELLDAEPIQPGEYVVVLSPDMAGLLAHEAFGHGVESDTIAKGRAKAISYMSRQVASPLVTMYDGAASSMVQNGSYLFDDEGSPSSSTLILDKGVLVSCISDRLSASELGLPTTGNGRRWSFERKAYARMTNTFFTGGTSKVEDLIGGVEHGWLLDRPNSGMEDPKNWGIQLVALVGREIKNGKLTGKIASPVVCTGSVPEVLKAVDAISDEVQLKGNGYCCKGHKEMVKVSSGGPWVRTVMRLG